MSLSYDLSAYVGSVISVMIGYNVEIIGEIVTTDLQSGCLVMKNIRRFDSATGNLTKWVHSIDDITPVDIGLSQDKFFMIPSTSILAAYHAITFV